MDIKTTRAEFNGSIILGIGSNTDIYNFFKYDLNIESNNYYNSGCYGWNYSIRSLNNTLKDLNYDVYIIDAYRNSPSRDKRINYKLIDKYFNRVIKNYNKKVDRWNYQEKEKLNKVIEYIENLKSYCLQEYENATDKRASFYFRGAYCNIYHCLNEIKEKFNIK